MVPSTESISCNRILVVDDDPDELLATARVLEKAGYIVKSVGSGREAIEAVPSFLPDLVLMDIVMPEMDGFEACRALKSDPVSGDVFVVLVSSVKKTSDYKAKGYRAGADGFIARPFHSHEFVERIASILRIKAVEKSLRIQQRWLRITLSSIGDGLIATDGEKRILFMNPAAERITGWRLEEARGKAIDQVLILRDDATRQTLPSPMDRVLHEGEALQLDDNVLLLNKNRRNVPIADSASPIRGDDGSILGGVLVFRDITEKRPPRRSVSDPSGSGRPCSAGSARCA